MRRRGTIVKWDEARAFGFIKPDDRTDDVFLHRAALRGRARNPAVGDVVEYELSYDARKRRRAQDAALVRSGLFGALLVIAVPAIVLGGATYAGKSAWIPMWVAVAYVTVSVITLLVYAVDKHRAGQSRWRISEATLHLLEVAGGWPGAFVAQRFLRHKNRKLSYQITYWLIVLAHLAFWSWFAATKLGYLAS